MARLARHVDLALADVDLSLSQYRMLMYLDEGAEVASSLADKLAITPPSVTHLVDGLVARGLVERRPNDQDRRRVGHAITDEGRHVLAQADAAVATRLEAIADHLDDRRQVTEAIEGLTIWRTAMDAFRAVKRGETK